MSDQATEYPVIYPREIDDLPDNTLRVTSLRVGLTKNQYVHICLGCYFQGEPDGLAKEFALPFPAAAQLSRHLKEVVQKYLDPEASQ